MLKGNVFFLLTNLPSCIHKTPVKIKCKFKPFNSNQKWWYYLQKKTFFVNSQGNFLKLLTCLTFSKSKINLIVRFYMKRHFLFGPSNFHNTKKIYKLSQTYASNIIYSNKNYKIKTV